MIRKDVMHQAEKLGAATRTDPLIVYTWLMQVGKAKGKNPRGLDIRTSGRLIYLYGEHNEFRLEPFRG